MSMEESKKVRNNIKTKRRIGEQDCRESSRMDGRKSGDGEDGAVHIPSPL